MKPGHMLRILSLLGLIALLLVLSGAQRAHVEGLILSSAPASVATDATITVNSTADVIDGLDSQCTLREAITAANTDSSSGPSVGECPAGSGPDTITLPGGTYTLTITGQNEDSNATGDLDIRSVITINGAGADSTIIQAGTTDSNGVDRVFQVVVSSDDLTLNGVTIRHGKAIDFSAAGGGVHNSGSLTIENSTISDNTAVNSDGRGGGVYSYSGPVTIKNSTISGNSAGRLGGGFYIKDGSTVTILNSTISGNSTIQTGESGGGGLDVSGGTVSIEHSTITSNTSASAFGEGIVLEIGTVNLKNTIVANNGSGASGDCGIISGTLNSLGYNLVGTGTGCPSGGTGDQTTSDPGLDPLADYGGTTQTHAVQSGSPALDAIPDGTNGCGTEYTSDQRGESRPQGGGCDVGAFELISDPKTWDGDGGDGLWSTAANWNHDTLPAPGDKVLLDNPAPTSITMDTNVKIQDLTISGVGASLSPGGAFTLVLKGFIQSDGAFTAPSGMTVSGDFEHSGGTFSHNNGTVTFNSSGTQTYSGTTVFHDVTVESGSTLQLATGCDFGFAGALILDGVFDTTSNSPTTVRLAGSGVQTFPSGIQLDYLIINSPATLSAPTNLNVAGGWTSSGGFIHNTGTVTFNGGSAQIYSGTTVFYNVTVESGSTIYLAANSDFGYAGTFTLNGSLDTITYIPNTVRLAYSGTQSLPSGATTLHSLAIESGTTLSAPTSLSLAGDMTNGGVFTHNGGTVTFNGSGTQLYGGTTIFHDVTVESGSTLQLAAGSDFGYEGNFTLSGSFDATTTSPTTVRLAWSGTQSLPSGATTLHSLVIESGVTLSFPSTLHIAGDWTNNGTFIHNNMSVWFNGSGAQTISGNNTFRSLIINNTSPNEKVDASGSTLKVERTLNIQDGIFVSASEYEDVDIRSDGTLELSGDITVSLNWECFGSLVPNNHRVTFDGSTAQSFLGATIFHDVTVESSAALILMTNSDFGYSGTVTLNGDFNATNNPPTTVRLAGDGVQTLPPGVTDFHHLVIDSESILSASLGNLYISGDWTNSGGFQANGGKVIIDGTGTQTMDGVTSFHNLTVESGSTLQLATDAVLGYTDEVIADGTLDLLTNAPTTLMVSGPRYLSPLHTTTHNLVFNDSLLGYWKLDEGSGTTTVDSSGYGQDGSLAYDTAWVTDTPAIDFYNPSALSFDGSGDYVNITGTPEIDAMQEFTIAAWVKLNSTPSGNMRFVTLRNEKAVLRYDDGDLHYFVKIDGSYHNIRSDSTLSSGAWMHVAGSYDGSTMRLYLNGVEQSTTVSVSGTVQTGNGIHLSGAETLDGLMDDVRVYNRALAATEIGDLADGKHPQTSIATTSLGDALDVDGDLTLNSGTLSLPAVAGYWKLNESTGTTAADSSGNSYDGTLINSPTWSSDIPSTHFNNPYALDFNRADIDYVDIPSTTAIDGLQEFSLAAWVKLDALPASDIQRFVTLGNQKACLRYDGISGNGQLDFFIKDDVGGIHHTRKNDALSAGEWLHVAGTYDGATMRLYLNGSEQASNSVSMTVAAGDGVRLSWGNTAESLEGLLDDVRVYDWVLSASQVQALADGFDVRDHDISVAGDFVRNGGVFEAGGGMVTFDGSGTQTLDTDAISLHHVFLSGGTTLVTEADLTINGTVLRQNGSASQETKDVEGAGPLSFPLAGVDVDVDTQDTLSSLVVHRQETDHPHRAAAILGGAYWSITPTGAGYTVDLTLPQEAFPDPYVCRYDDPGWNCARDAKTNETVTRNGITELSDWAVGESPCVAAVTPTSTSISLTGAGNTDVLLGWEDNWDNAGYEVHRNTSPYFTPDSGSLHDTLPAGSTSYTDSGAAGATGENYTYIVRGIGNCGAVSSFEKRLGEFDFGVLPGNE